MDQLMIDLTSLKNEQQRRRGDYPVRTRYRGDDGTPLYVNELVFEQSPYLLAHAHNPVHWRSWNDQTFDDAKALNRPVFLSIGYSTCHWCHVMEEESFDNLEVAQRLNDGFVAIKVDREQRPDLDEIYMTAVQIIRGTGGWPMSVFLTPDGKPFFAGTYYTRTQFLDLLEQVSRLWADEQNELCKQADELAGQIARSLQAQSSTASLRPDIESILGNYLLKVADPQQGGFGSAPKFPQEPFLLFLLDQVSRDTRPLADNPLWLALANALDHMLCGGIYDQLGGGFHRYAVDNGWVVPHFEKMLYNQAQLLKVYSQAWRLSGQLEYRRIAYEIVQYVITDMQRSDGCFFSAQDADSEGVEGKFFVWTVAELQALLSAGDWALVQQVYGVTDEGNFEGANILTLGRPLPEWAAQLAMPYRELLARINAIKNQLLAARRLRVAPLTDEKVIAEWNGMMIGALAEAADIFDDPMLVDIAIHAAQGVWFALRQNDNRLKRQALGSQASEQAVLEDYAHLSQAMLAVYDVDQNPVWLSRTMALMQTAKAQFWDEQHGGFFISDTAASGPLILRSKSLADTATVGGNSQMLSALVALAQRCADIHVAELAQRQAGAFADVLNNNPAAAPWFLVALAQWRQANPVQLQYTAGGHVRVSLRQVSIDADVLDAEVTISMTQDWLIYSADSAAESTADSAADSAAGGHPTRLSLADDSPHQLLEVVFPDSVTPAWAETESSTRAYQGLCKIRLRLVLSGQSPVTLALALQPCAQTVCDQPQTLNLTLWPRRS